MPAEGMFELGNPTIYLGTFYVTYSQETNLPLRKIEGSIVLLPLAMINSCGM